MTINAMPAMIGREGEWERLKSFATTGSPFATLGIVWGRRRVGKSFMLEWLASQTNGFYYHALRGSSGEALRGLGDALSAHLKLPAPLAFDTWEHAMDALMALGRDRDALVVLDEFPYLLEHTPNLDSIIQRLYGPGHPAKTGTRTRLLLCGSSISVMSKLLTGTAPLRGRAGLDLRVSPFDFRVARTLHHLTDLSMAVETYAVIGGVAAYAREMCDHDLPTGRADFDRWICQRVLSPAAPLFGEITLLLSEDPVTAKARKLNLYHATLAAVALGNHTWGAICNYVKTSASSLMPIMDTLIASELVARVPDPIRDNRPLYHVADPLLRFHYAIIRRQQHRLARMSAHTESLWRDLIPTFRSLVLGPSFEAMAREWTTHIADATTTGGAPEHVGSTVLLQGSPDAQEIDVVVASDDHGVAPQERTILALGEAKVAAPLTMHHVRRLETARRTVGERGRHAKLLLFGTHIEQNVREAATGRSDLEVIDLDRLYNGQ